MKDKTPALMLCMGSKQYQNNVYNKLPEKKRSIAILIYKRDSTSIKVYIHDRKECAYPLTGDPDLSGWGLVGKKTYNSSFIHTNQWRTIIHNIKLLP